MAYEKQTWTTGDTITAEKLNHIEDGIADGEGMTNPMTTEGDIVVGGIDGEPTRLGVGTNGQVLTSNGTTASWQTPSGGDTSSKPVLPMMELLNVNLNNLPNIMGSENSIEIEFDENEIDNLWSYFCTKYSQDMTSGDSAAIYFFPWGGHAGSSSYNYGYFLKITGEWGQPGATATYSSSIPLSPNTDPKALVAPVAKMMTIFADPEHNECAMIFMKHRPLDESDIAEIMSICSIVELNQNS